MPPCLLKAIRLKFGFAVPWLAIGILWFLAGAEDFVSKAIKYIGKVFFFIFGCLSSAAASNRSWLNLCDGKATKHCLWVYYYFICIGLAVTLLWSF